MKDGHVEKKESKHKVELEKITKEKEELNYKLLIKYAK